MSAGSDVAYYLDRVREVLANADRGLTDVESNKKMSDADKRKVSFGCTLCVCAPHYRPGAYRCTSRPYIVEHNLPPPLPLGSRNLPSKTLTPSKKPQPTHHPLSLSLACSSVTQQGARRHREAGGEEEGGEDGVRKAEQVRAGGDRGVSPGVEGEHQVHGHDGGD